MKSVADLLAEARRLGIGVWAEGGKLKVRCPRQYEALARTLLERKAEVMALLNPTPPPAEAGCILALAAKLDYPEITGLLGPIGRIPAGEAAWEVAVKTMTPAERQHLLERLTDEIPALLKLPQPELAILEGHRSPEPDDDAEREAAELAWCYALHRPVPQHYWPFIEAMGFSIRQLPPRKDFHEIMRRAHMLIKRNPNLRPIARSLLRWILSSESDGYLERAFGRGMEFKKCVSCGADFVTDSGERMCLLCKAARKTQALTLL